MRRVPVWMTGVTGEHRCVSWLLVVIKVEEKVVAIEGNRCAVGGFGVTVLAGQEGSGDESRFGPNQRACQPSLLIEEWKRDRVFYLSDTLSRRVEESQGGVEFIRQKNQQV
ncbi:hypothetical protein HanRHA438_Chr01g0046211 [Helianthus annuus]|nr:hypothetical protein HanRHA438_Chr01g0046211 [Helianthus annuus]